MFRFSIREMKLDFLRLFKGWRLGVMIGISLCYYLIVLLDHGNSIRYISWLAIILPLMMMPEISRLHYLLPGDRRDLMLLLLYKGISYLFFEVVLAILLILISNLLNGKAWTYLFDRLFIEMLPFLITYVAVCLNGRYNALTTKNSAWMRKNRYLYWFSMGTLMIPVFFGSIEAVDFFKGIWYHVFSALSYLSTALIVFWQIQAVRHTDLSYENIKKVEKLFG